jgi:hypothetical protein
VDKTHSAALVKASHALNILLLFSKYWLPMASLPTSWPGIKADTLRAVSKPSKAC